MKITASAVREMYSQPVPYGLVDKRGGYCVGGALWLFLKDTELNMDLGTSFPNIYELEVILCEANPALTPELAEQYAHDIIKSNESTNMEYAWTHLDRALSHGAGDNAQTVRIDEYDLCLA